MTIHQQIVTLKQIAIMLKAGIPIDVALVELNMPIYNNIYKSINSGLSLSDALSKHKDVFSNLTITMVKLGETTGKLPNSIFKLVNILELTLKNRQMIKQAIRMPIITITTLIVAFISLMIFMVPTFSEIFQKYELSLPILTRVMIDIEQIIKYYGEVILFILLFVYMLVYYLYKNNDSMNLFIDKFIVSKYFYIINKIIFRANMYRYHLVLSEMLSAGIPIDNSLDKSLEIVDNNYLKSKLNEIITRINKGYSLYDAMKSIELYDSISLNFIKVGESSGTLDSMIKEISNIYYEELMKIIDNITAYIEPILTFVISLLILFFALGILMPMWDLTSLTRI